MILTLWHCISFLDNLGRINAPLQGEEFLFVSGIIRLIDCPFPYSALTYSMLGVRKATYKNYCLLTLICSFSNSFVVFEEPEDPGARSFFSEIISSISDVRFSHNGRYMLTRDYLTVKVWDVNMENKPMEVYNVHDYLRSKLCSLYENDCIFDKFECVWNGNDGWVSTLEKCDSVLFLLWVLACGLGGFWLFRIFLFHLSPEYFHFIFTCISILKVNPACMTSGTMWLASTLWR